MRSHFEFLVLAIICAVACAQAPGAKILREKLSHRMGGEMEVEKYIPIGDMKLKLQSVARSTYSLFNAFQRHDLTTAMSHVSRRSIIIDHTLLPTNGVYQGRRGFLESLEKYINTVHLTDSSFRVLYVDEARGMSVVEKTCSGAFRHNNASFENAKVMVFIKWSLGKISKLNIVEMNPSHIYSIYHSKAEKQYMKLLNTLFVCGGSCNEVRNYMTDDITLKFNNFYPVSLLLKANATVPGMEEGRDLDITIKGKDNVMKYAAFADKLYFNFTSSIKILYSDDKTIVAAKKISPYELSMGQRKKAYYKGTTIIYVINHFDERGLIKSAEFYLNRPLLPWDLRYVDNLLKESDEKTSLYDLFASLQPAVSVTAASK